MCWLRNPGYRGQYSDVNWCPGIFIWKPRDLGFTSRNIAFRGVFRGRGQRAVFPAQKFLCKAEKDSFSLEDGKFDFYEKFLTDFLMCLRRPCKQKLSFLPGREIQKYDFAMKMFSDFLYWIQVQEVQVHQVPTVIFQQVSKTGFWSQQPKPVL